MAARLGDDGDGSSKWRKGMRQKEGGKNKKKRNKKNKTKIDAVT